MRCKFTFTSYHLSLLITEIIFLLSTEKLDHCNLVLGILPTDIVIHNPKHYEDLTYLKPIVCLYFDVMHTSWTADKPYLRGHQRSPKQIYRKRVALFIFTAVTAIISGNCRCFISAMNIFPVQP